MKLNVKKGVMLSFFLLGAVAVNAQGLTYTLTIKPDKPLPGYKAFLFYKGTGFNYYRFSGLRRWKICNDR